MCAFGHKLCTCSCPVEHRSCHDDSTTMKRNTGYTCEEVATRNMCALGRKSCECSCPAAAHSASRHLFGVMAANKCPMGTFDATLKDIERECCVGVDCEAGLPSSCTFACAQVLPPFFDQCRTVLKSVDVDNFGGYTQLAELCTALPTAPMLDAIIGVCVVPHRRALGITHRHPDLCAD